MKIYFSIFTILLPHVCHSTKPDVLFIIVDDLRPALGIYGDPNAHTPHINKLAMNSFVFTNVFAQVGSYILTYLIINHKFSKNIFNYYGHR